MVVAKTVLIPIVMLLELDSRDDDSLVDGQLPRSSGNEGRLVRDFPFGLFMNILTLVMVVVLVCVRITIVMLTTKGIASPQRETVRRQGRQLRSWSCEFGPLFQTQPTVSVMGRFRVQNLRVYSLGLYRLLGHCLEVR